MSEELTNLNTGIIGWTSNKGEDISVPVKDGNDFEYNRVIALNKDGTVTDTHRDGRHGGEDTDKRPAWNIGNFILGPRDERKKSAEDGVGDFELNNLEDSKSCLNTVYYLNKKNNLVAKKDVYNTGAGETILSGLSPEVKKDLFKDGKAKGPENEDAYRIGNREVLSLRTPIEPIDPDMGV